MTNNNLYNPGILLYNLSIWVYGGGFFDGFPWLGILFFYNFHPQGFVIFLWLHLSTWVITAYLMALYSYSD